MIITCNECSTNYNLNESLLKPEGTKVRCSVCNSIFTAFPPVESIPATGLEVPVFEPKHTYSKTGIDDDIKTQSPAVSGDNLNGMIAYLELDEKSLGIEDIISDIIFIPKEPEDFEPETVFESELVPDIMPVKGKEKEDTRLFDKSSNGELTDLDLSDDNDMDLDDDFDLVEEIPSEEDEHQDIDIEFSPEDIGEPSPDAEEIEAPPALDDQDVENDDDIELIEDSSDFFETLESIEDDIEDEPVDTDTDAVIDDTDAVIEDTDTVIKDTDFDFETELSMEMEEEDTEPSDDTPPSFGEDDFLEMDESAMEFEDDGPVLEEDSDVFEFDEDDTISLESADTIEDEFSGALAPDEEDDILDTPDFAEAANEFEPDDEFEFDTDGELTLIDDDLPEENGLSFDDDLLEDEEDMLVLEEDTAEFEADGDLLLEDEDGLEFAEIETELMEDDGDMLVSDDWSDTDSDTHGRDEIAGAFELEFDVDSDLELDDDIHDPDYLVQDASDDEEDTLEMMEIESENDGDAFLEDFSHESDFNDYDDSLEDTVEPEIIIEDDEDTGGGLVLTKASIQRPLPPPLTREHLGKIKKTKKGGSKIVSFFFFLVFLAILVLLTYSAGVMTGTRIPYISDLKIPLIDQYLKPPAPLPEPARVHPTEQSVSGSFVANESAGTLFVITGKILNDSNIFVSRVKVRGSLIADNKVKVKEMMVFCGNILTKEQLEKGNIADLNKLLQRSAGENNSNIRIKPHGSVQFMVVFSELPELLQNFEVEVVEFERNDKSQ